MKKAILFQKMDNGKVQCTACAHYFKIAEGTTGICGVRKNINGELFLLVYGLVAAIHLDPIEKKPLYHFMPGTEILSFGTVGCNMKCSFCQNWQISQVSKKPHLDMFGTEYSPVEIIEFAQSAGAPSIAYTYSEPGVFFEYAYDTMRLAHEVGMKNVYVSNGYISKEAREKLKDLLDAANIDLKSLDKSFYRKICGAKLEPVLDTIKDLYNTGIHLELTTLIIPGENDSEENLQSIASFIAELDKNIPWHISRFFPNFKMRDKPETPLKTLRMAEKIAKKAGLKYIHVGNI